MDYAHRGKNPSTEEICYWIVRKRKAARRLRLQHYWKTGRVLPFVGDHEPALDSVNDSPGGAASCKRGRATAADQR